jgi:hypothetical protein
MRRVVVIVDRCPGHFPVQRAERQRIECRRFECRRFCDQRRVFARLGRCQHLGCRGVGDASVHVG